MKERFLELIEQLPGYEARPQQIEMVERIASAIEKRQHVIIEAGTGSGKSLGYLFPAVESGLKVVISTGTIALQEQLLEKDIPFVQSVHPRTFAAAIAKGRSNYLCRQKLWEAERQLLPNDPLRNELNQIIYAQRDWEGDVADLPFQPTPSLWREIASDGDDCLGPRCEFFDHTPHRTARQRLAEADIVVTNHALYFADVASGGNILPAHDLVIFDEAHLLPRAASNALTAQVGRFATSRLLQKIQRRLNIVPNSLRDRLINLELDLLEWLMSKDRSLLRLPADRDFISMTSELATALTDLRHWLSLLDLGDLKLPDAALKTKSAVNRDNLVNSLSNLINRWQFFTRDPESEMRVNWAEINRGKGMFYLYSAPLDVADELAEHLWSKRMTICTSATLAVKDDFKHFRQAIGLDAADELVLPSPFDFSRQAALYIPPGLPEPNSPIFIPQASAVISEVLELTQGRAFLLFSSYRAMLEAYEILGEHLPFPCAKQGDLPRKRLVEWFKNTPQSVLFATASFWEGIDVPGDGLSCVVIDRLPFQVPDDPVVQARVEYMKQRGENWFANFMLPEAITRLRQGFGRLIRTKEDCGLVVILDNRLRTKSYGTTVLGALPPAKRVRSLDEASDFIKPL